METPSAEGLPCGCISSSEGVSWASLDLDWFDVVVAAVGVADLQHHLIADLYDGARGQLIHPALVDRVGPVQPDEGLLLLRPVAVLRADSVDGPLNGPVALPGTAGEKQGQADNRNAEKLSHRKPLSTISRLWTKWL